MGCKKEAWAMWWWEASLEDCLREAASWSGGTMGQLVEGDEKTEIVGTEVCSVSWILLPLPRPHC